jgi:hypothetical protein
VFTASSSQFAVFGLRPLAVSSLGSVRARGEAAKTLFFVAEKHYNYQNEDAEIIGFFSTEHKGVFTHHDSFLHMHLITKDESKMGHLDELKIGKMKLYLPKK